MNNGFFLFFFSSFNVVWLVPRQVIQSIWSNQELINYRNFYFAINQQLAFATIYQKIIRMFTLHCIVRDKRTLMRSIQTSQYKIGRVYASCQLNVSPFRISLWRNALSFFWYLYPMSRLTVKPSCRWQRTFCDIRY